MTTFKDLLFEHALAKEGDFAFNFVEVGKPLNRSLLKFNKEKELGKFENFKVLLFKYYKSPFVLVMNKENEVITKMGLKFIQNDRFLKIKSNKTYQIKAVETSPEFRGDNITKKLYRFLILECNYTLVGDTEQYEGARFIWCKLSKENDIRVGSFIQGTNKVLYDNIILDGPSDERIWTKNAHDNMRTQVLFATKN